MKRKEGGLLPILDVLVGPAGTIVNTLIQYNSDWPIFNREYLRAALGRQDVRDELFSGSWWFRWDNAGRVDTVMRELGYEVDWSDITKAAEAWDVIVWWAQAGGYRRIP